MASGLFFVLFVAVFGRPVASSAGVAAFTLLFYVPLSYYLDHFFYRRRVRQAQKPKETT